MCVAAVITRSSSIVNRKETQIPAYSADFLLQIDEKRTFERCFRVRVCVRERYERKTKIFEKKNSNKQQSASEREKKSARKILLFSRASCVTLYISVSLPCDVYMCVLHK